MNIRLVRKKIKSVTNVKKITKAMQMVSAIKMKKSQLAAVEGKPYRQNLAKIIHKLVTTLEAGFSPLMATLSAVNKTLVVLVSSDKGLCGSFNFNLFRFLLNNIEFKENDFITIGRKGAMFASKMGGNIIADFSTGSHIDNVSAAFKTVLLSYGSGKYKQVILIYNRFINTLKFEPVKEIILPININSFKDELPQSSSEYIVEPSAETIIEQILRSLTEEKIRGAIVDSDAAEHSARMIAMKNATDNAMDVIYNLTLLRNKLRQEKITYELLDMVTAKESVEAT